MLTVYVSSNSIDKVKNLKLKLDISNDKQLEGGSTAEQPAENDKF